MRECRRRPARSLPIPLILLSLLAPVTVSAETADARRPTPRGVGEVQEVRTVWTGEFGVPHPAGIAYVSARGELLVAARGRSATSVLRLGFDEDPRGTFRLGARLDRGTLAFDPTRNRLWGTSDGDLVTVAARDLGLERPPIRRTDLGGMGVEHPRGATVDPETGTWFFLDGGVPVVMGRDGIAAWLDPDGLEGRFSAIAFDPSNGLLYVFSPEEDRLYGLNESGEVRATYGLARLHLMDPSGMTFAPSSDPTDGRRSLHLFIADAGGGNRLGGVVEVKLEEASATAAPVDTATLVQVIATSAWNPGSPDPSGVEYLGNRFQITDSEVDETTGAGYHGVNLWQVSTSGSVLDTGTTVPWSKEPTGLGYDAGTNTLFVSDDAKKKVFVVKPGNDGRFGTGDDVVTSVNAGAFSPPSSDTEDPEFLGGHLFVLDGVGTEIYDVNPVNGVFGDGNDQVTHFDIGALGAADYEGLGSDPTSGNLVVGARATKRIYEITTSGTLVRTIDASGIPNSTFRYISGLDMGPASSGGGQNYWVVDRAVDNGSNPNENDGKLVELTVAGSTNNPPVVTNPGTMTNTVGDSVSYQIQASDPDPGDTIDSYGATGLPTGLSVNTTTGLITGTTTTAGVYAVTISATDNHGATGNANFTWNVNPPGGNQPTVTGFTPTSGPVGTPVTIDGTNFTGATDVKFNGTSVGGAFVVVDDTHITTAVPTGATTGPISVTGPGGTGTSSSSFTVTGTGGTLTFPMDADTYIAMARPTKNFGSKTPIYIDSGSTTRDILLTFTVTGVGGSAISSVKLRLHCTDGSALGGNFFVTDPSWQESTVTWSTAPPPQGSAVASLGPVSAGTWYEVNLTSLVTGDGTYSLRVSTTSTNAANYVSKEGSASLRPQLVVTLA